MASRCTQQRNYAGIVTKTDHDVKDCSIRDVSVKQSDSLMLRPLDVEAAAWIRFINTEWPAQQ